ncbi:MAG: hypothetical protein CL678_12985 [Bdellovibrionaceae bacterium]|nr:hypothetical protein [Pseudobdellovibrionaceae bacterium]|tara:strand:+ start:5597 stop:7171 length:1575 start_codon:yes stop_codon:yes gene_type:complete
MIHLFLLMVSFLLVSCQEFEAYSLSTRREPLEIFSVSDESYLLYRVQKKSSDSRDNLDQVYVMPLSSSRYERPFVTFPSDQVDFSRLHPNLLTQYQSTTGSDSKKWFNLFFPVEELYSKALMSQNWRSDLYVARSVRSVVDTNNSISGVLWIDSNEDLYLTYSTRDPYNSDPRTGYYPNGTEDYELYSYSYFASDGPYEYDSQFCVKSSKFLCETILIDTGVDTDGVSMSLAADHIEDQYAYPYDLFPDKTGDRLNEWGDLNQNPWRLQSFQFSLTYRKKNQSQTLLKNIGFKREVFAESVTFKPCYYDNIEDCADIDRVEWRDENILIYENTREIPLKENKVLSRIKKKSPMGNEESDYENILFSVNEDEGRLDTLYGSFKLPLGDCHSGYLDRKGTYYWTYRENSQFKVQIYSQQGLVNEWTYWDGSKFNQDALGVWGDQCKISEHYNRPDSFVLIFDRHDLSDEINEFDEGFRREIKYGVFRNSQLLMFEWNKDYIIESSRNPQELINDDNGDVELQLIDD